MNIKCVYIFAFTLFVLSCKGSKGIAESNTNISKMSSEDIIKTHDRANPKFLTLAARMQVVYENNKKHQSITVSLRMEKDKKIWIKASLLGITIAKALITPEAVSYYETLTNTYFEGDFSLLSDWLGIDIDFQKAQSLLLGQSIFNLDAKYKVVIATNKYKLQPKQQPNNFKHALLLNADNFKISSESLSQPKDNRMFTVNYGNYQKIKEGYYPTEIRIITTDNGDLTKIGVNFKKIDHNASIRFPFSIPRGYEEIRLN